MGKRPPPPDLQGPIEPVNLREALEERYLAYALSTIMHRALPDVRDGLKPVHRRVLYAMRQLRLEPQGEFRKCAKIVGDTMGNFHPHGNQAIYDALARLAQDFSVRYPLIDGQGNFGNIDGDNPAADRYTEARLTEIAAQLLDGIDEDTVDFRPNYDGREMEPSVLPGNFPNLLANGASGIAVGMATNIPPHNAGELCDAALHLIKFPNATADKLVDFVPGPDLPTGGILVEPRDSIVQAYKTGRGSFRLRARWTREDTGRGTYQIVVTEIPYQIPKARLVARIAELLQAKKLPLLADVRDELAEDVRLVLEPKSRTVDPVLLMEQMFKLTELETRVPLNMNVLTRGQVPNVLSLRQVLREWLDHRLEVLVRGSKHRLGKIDHRLEVLDGFLIVYLNIDKVIKIIREKDEPKPALMKAFQLTEVQAEAILNMRLRSLRKLEEMEIRREHDSLTKERKELKALLASEDKQWKKIADEIKSLKDRFGQKTELGRRRTSFEVAPEGMAEDLGRGPDREGAGDCGPLREGLDPRHQGPSRRARRPCLQGGRPAEARRAHPDHGHAAPLRHQWPLLHALPRQAAERARPRRALPPDDRHRGNFGCGRAVRARRRPQAAGREHERPWLHRAGGRGRCLDAQGQAGAECRHGR